MTILLRWRIISIVLIMSLFLSPRSGARAAQSARPNILLIITDDQRYDTMNAMPRTKARIFDQGITFSNAYCTTPLCSPSRASILTGLFAHNHGIRNNSAPLNRATVIKDLHDNGYYTGMVGKYIGYWNGTPRPEFDYWAAFKGTTSPFVDPTINVNGVQQVVKGYITYLLRDFAVDFLDRASNQDKPFALVVAPNAPHDPADPPTADANLYPNLPPYRPPSYGEDMSDKSVSLQRLPTLTAQTAAEVDVLRRKQLQSLNSVDQMVDRLLTQLQQQGKLHNTMVIYMSDNGFMLGEHNRDGKKLGYEESARIPLAIRYPPLVAAARKDPNIVANIDIAPTLYELAGIPIPADIDGRSLLPLLREDMTTPSGPTDSKARTAARTRSLLLEGWNGPPWSAIRYRNYSYIQFNWDRPELYDLTVDPYQMNNRAEYGVYANILADLRQRLNAQAAPMPEGDDTSDKITYDGWKKTRDPAASSGAMHTSAIRDQKATYFTAYATDSVSFISARGPTYGKARVFIDDVYFETIDLYAAVPQYGVVFTYQGLNPSLHKIQIQITGERNPASKGTTVVVDGMRVGNATLDDDYPEIAYSAWGGLSNAAEAVSGSSFRRSNTSGSKLTFSFTGTRFTWIAAVAPFYGLANVYVDGALNRTVDLYATRQRWQQRIVFDGFSAGTHTVTIMPLGAHQRNSTGDTIVFDGFTVP